MCVFFCIPDKPALNAWLLRKDAAEEAIERRFIIELGKELTSTKNSSPNPVNAAQTPGNFK